MKRLYIVIADDDDDDRFLLRTAFTENGFQDELKFITNGYDLLIYLNGVKNAENVEKLPDFIILDLNMPKKDGREVLSIMKSDEFLSKIPVFVFSTTSNNNEKKKCLEYGAISYYTKPVTFDGLIRIAAEIRNTFILLNN